MNRIEKTAHLHQNGGLTCTQAILTVFGPTVGIAAEQAKVMGRALCGINIGKFGVCGYISGAALLLGMSHDQPDEAEEDHTRTNIPGGPRHAAIVRLTLHGTPPVLQDCLIVAARS